MTTKIPARDWTFEVSDGAATPTWTEVLGINSFTLGSSEVQTETTDFASDGDAEHVVMERSKTLQLDGFHLEDASGNRDPGQEEVEAVAELKGAASLREFRVTSPGGVTKTFNASATLGDVGGGNNDNTSWSVTLTRSGPTTTV